jgi:hypothetical protein
MDKKRQQYYQDYVDHLAKQIIPSDEIKSFVGNHPTLIGDFAEAQVRRFIRQIISPLRVSRGAVITPEIYGENRAKQIDTIIWTPNPLPSLIDIDNFSLVPWTNSMGVIEIKSSAYNGVGKEIAKVLDMECDITCGRKPADTRGIPAVLGVIVLQKSKITNTQLNELIDQGKVIVLIKKNDAGYSPNVDAILKFVNFLGSIRSRAEQLSKLRIEPFNKNIFVDDSATAI